MSTRVLGLSGSPENSTVLVQHDGRTLRVPVPPALRPAVEQSVGSVLPATVAEQLLAGGDLGPRAMAYDDNTGSAFDPRTGAFPAADAGVGAVATRALTPSEELMGESAQPPQDWLSGPILQNIQRAGHGGSLPEVRAALEEAAARVGVHPAALAAMVNTESRFDPAASHGSYRGATQMGPATFREAGGRLGGVTFEEYQRLPLADQIRIYPEYLQHYGRADLIRELAAGQTPSMQAALLQGFQFAPNDPGRPSDQSFVAALRSGDLSRRTTPHPQARFLGDTSLAQMRDYYESLIGGAPTPLSVSSMGGAPRTFPPRFEDVQNDPQASPTQPRAEALDPEAAIRARLAAGAPPPEATQAALEEASQTFGERLMAGLEDLPEAFRYLELADNSQRLRPGPPPPINRGRQNTGARALQRMGIGSLA